MSLFRNILKTKEMQKFLTVYQSTVCSPRSFKRFAAVYSNQSCVPEKIIAQFGLGNGLLGGWTLYKLSSFFEFITE